MRSIGASFEDPQEVLRLVRAHLQGVLHDRRFQAPLRAFIALLLSAKPSLQHPDRLVTRVSMATLADILGTSPQNVRRSVQTLVEMGVVDSIVRGNGAGQVAIYEIRAAQVAKDVMHEDSRVRRRYIRFNAVTGLSIDNSFDKRHKPG